MSLSKLQANTTIIKYFLFDNKMENVERIKLGYYGRLRNLDKVFQGFRPANLVFFDIKNAVFTSLKEN